MHEDIESNLDDHKYSMLAVTGNAASTILDEFDFYNAATNEDYANNNNELTENKNGKLLLIKNEDQQKNKGSYY